jgi:monoamine oxidase
MTKTDILIIGAGAAGLMAARNLAKAGKKVIVLEARNRSGGRIHTISQESFFKHAELGAEFVHGDLPVTLNLLKEAGIKYHSAVADMWQYKSGKFVKEQEFVPRWGDVIKCLEALQEDISIEQFLEASFTGDDNEDLRNAVRQFVSGYDTANPNDASAFALRKEWQSEDSGAQHRIAGGYCAMIKYLDDECKAHGGMVYLNSPVAEVQWQPGKITAIVEDGTAYQASQILLALPLGVLQIPQGENGAIKFTPPIEKQTTALKAMAFGAVLKVLLEFDDRFWENEETENMGYIISEEEIPTWWTQIPEHNTVLTGWLGGPPAAQKRDTSQEELLRISLQSLANIFKRDVEELKGKLLSFNIINWTAEPYTRGSYAYDTVAAPASRKVLNEPVDNTLYFAGEYLYEGTAMGTVEAALTSGAEVAKKMLTH